MGQRFFAHPTDTFTWPNGAIGHRTYGRPDILGPYAKVRKCPVHNTTERLTCYATGYPDSPTTVPACTLKAKKYVPGQFVLSNDNIEFHPAKSHQHLFNLNQEQST